MQKDHLILYMYMNVLWIARWLTDSIIMQIQTHSSIDHLLFFISLSVKALALGELELYTCR